MRTAQYIRAGAPKLKKKAIRFLSLCDNVILGKFNAIIIYEQ